MCLLLMVQIRDVLLHGTCLISICQMAANHGMSSPRADEAGQAIEPEALVPLSLLGPRGGSVMLCGDPRRAVTASLHVNGNCAAGV